MPRNPKPLTILVADELFDLEPVQKLLEKGHTVVPFKDVQLPLNDYDLIFSPKGWRMTYDLVKHVELAVTASRAVKYGKKKKEED